MQSCFEMAEDSSYRMEQAMRWAFRRLKDQGVMSEADEERMMAGIRASTRLQEAHRRLKREIVNVGGMLA